MMSNSVLLENALTAYQQGKKEEAILLIDRFCSYCILRGRNKSCGRCRIQQALNTLKGGC